jgi:elongation factor G
VDETILRGSSELHLRTVLEKMKSQYQLEVETRPPSIAYAETITQPAEGHHRHKKQSGGSGQFGEVFLRIEPLARGEGIELVNKIKGGTIPSQYLPGVEKGVHQAIESGVFAGYPMQDLRVTVYDGKHHAVDSKEIAFVLAGKKAFIDAIDKAKPIVLEPVVTMQINAPGEFTGDISADIASMRGMILGSKTRTNNQVEFDCQVPLSELTDYQTRLTSVTGGVGTFTMEFACYQPAPESVQAELHKRFKREEG